MSTSKVVDTKLLRSLVDATFPSYRRKTVRLVLADSATIFNLGWDSGSKNEYRECTLDGKPVQMHPLKDSTSYHVPLDHAVVQGGTFCGKPSLLFIHVQPDAIPVLAKLLMGDAADDLQRRLAQEDNT